MKVCYVVIHPRDGWFGSLQELFIEDIFEIHVEKMKGKNTGNKSAFLPSFTHHYMILCNFILWNTKVDILNYTFMLFLNQFWNLKASVPITSLNHPTHSPFVFHGRKTVMQDCWVNYVFETSHLFLLLFGP